MFSMQSMFVNLNAIVELWFEIIIVVNEILQKDLFIVVCLCGLHVRY